MVVSFVSTERYEQVQTDIEKKIEEYAEEHARGGCWFTVVEVKPFRRTGPSISIRSQRSRFESQQ